MTGVVLCPALLGVWPLLDQVSQFRLCVFVYDCGRSERPHMRRNGLVSGLRKLACSQPSGTRPKSITGASNSSIYQADRPGTSPLQASEVRPSANYSSKAVLVSATLPINQ